MSSFFKFKIESLLTEKNGEVSGPMGPALFAGEMAKQEGFKYDSLARVWFDDAEIFQEYEGESLTGFDCLIIGKHYDNDLLLTLWVDMGTGGLPVAMCYRSERDPVVTPVYKRKHFAKKLSDDQISEIFDHIFDHEETLAIVKG